MPAPTRSEQLLVDLCRRNPTRDLLRTLRDLGDDVDARRDLGELALRHGVFGLVLCQLESAALGNPSLPDGSHEFLASLKTFRHQAVMWDLEYERVLHALRGLPSNPVVLKGAALRITLYEESAQRPIGDFDLLVPTEEATAAVDALEKAGYEGPPTQAITDAYVAHHFHHRVLHPNGFIVEIHWGLTRPDDPFRLDGEQFRRDSALVDRGPQPPIRVPCPEDMVLHMSTQNVDDGFARFGRLVDIDRLAVAHELDWDRIVRASRAGGLDGVVAVTLQLCARLLDTPVPAHVMRRLRPSRSVRTHIALMDPMVFSVSRSVHLDHAARRALRLWLIDGTQRRVRRGWRIVTDTEDAMRWVWAAKQERRARLDLLHATKSAMAFATHQLRFYTQSLWKLLTPSGRGSLRFWDPPLGTGERSESK